MEIKFNTEDMPKKGTFMWAIAQMKEGKKVTRSEWGLDASLSICDGDWFNLKNEYGDHKWFNEDFSQLKSVEAIDWIVVEEKKTLSDKIKSNAYIGASIRELDVKEALGKFIDWTKKQIREAYASSVDKEAKEIFGDRLI